MFFYRFKNKILISKKKLIEFESISEKEARNCKDTLFVLTSIEPMKSRRFFCITDSSLLFLKNESIYLLKHQEKTEEKIPLWLEERIKNKKLVSLNISYPNWEEVLTAQKPKHWRINIVGLGDVGGMLLSGIRLLGGKEIESIGIFDRNIKVATRWILETNQILLSFSSRRYPIVYPVKEEDLFNCDMLVFCASVGVPNVGQEKEDVRMAQYRGNSKIISQYARKAREKSFKGIFAILSDPVDLLCKKVFLESNTDNNNILDFKGLAPEQIRGYGLGVMNARAVYYADKKYETACFVRDGRVYGPHGKGLVIANSVKKYDKKASEILTNQVLSANLEVRKTGFKPYIAPALSSGCLSILATIRGHWHYSSTFLSGVYMGAKNRLHSSGIELERLNIPLDLMEKIIQTYRKLSNQL